MDPHSYRHTTIPYKETTLCRRSDKKHGQQKCLIGEIMLYTEI